MNCKICYKLYYEVTNTPSSPYVSLISPYESGRNPFRWVLNVCVGNRFEITHRVLSNKETLNRGGVVCSSVVFLMPPLIFLDPTGAYYYNTYWHSDFEDLWVRGEGGGSSVVGYDFVTMKFT